MKIRLFIAVLFAFFVCNLGSVPEFEKNGLGTQGGSPSENIFSRQEVGSGPPLIEKSPGGNDQTGGRELPNGGCKGLRFGKEVHNGLG